MMSLPTGKIPVDILRNVIFKHLGAKRKEVILGPRIGVDAAVVRVGSKALIVSTDPITGALGRIGWLAVNVNANDIATFGVRPTLFSSCMMLPSGSSNAMIKTISTQMDTAAKKLKMAIIGGHCETTPGITHPVVVGTAMGVTRRSHYVTSAGAKVGNSLILTKGAGIEGTAILATDRKESLQGEFNQGFLSRASAFFNRISVVEEAVAAFETGGVTAMHDPTEGGVAGGIHEIADASKLGVRIFEAQIRVQKETLEICRFFKIDPLQLIGSGALLVAARHEFVDLIIETLKKRRIQASIIGEFLKQPAKRILVANNGSEKRLVRPISDHLWTALNQSLTP